MISYKIANGHNETLEKIKRLDKEWESTLQSEGNKEDNYFIIDIDEDERETYETIYNALNEETDIITSMKTPNGYHIITHPFNYTEFDHFNNDEIEIKTDGMMFLQMQD